MKPISYRQWIFYAVLCSLLPTIAMILISDNFHLSKEISFSLPGALYGVVLYIVGRIGRQYLGGKIKHILIFTGLVIGTATASYAAITDYLPIVIMAGGSEELSNLIKTIRAAGIGAFIVGCTLIFCWSIKRERIIFLILIVVAGITVPILWLFLKNSIDFLPGQIKNLLFIFAWQAILLIVACSFMIRLQKTNK